LLQRVFKKASTYGQELGVSETEKKYKIEPSRVEELYREYVIPLTKEVEVFISVFLYLIYCCISYIR
jgi:hypothetical protein